jgi:hypothetical protein
MEREDGEGKGAAILLMSSRFPSIAVPRLTDP